jgi:hypothetical protein
VGTYEIYIFIRKVMSELIERNLRRDMREDLKNVEFWVKHSNTYNQWRELGILGSKTKN